MSRIGKRPIELPAKVKCNIDDQGNVVVEGPKGSLSWTLPTSIAAEVSDNKLNILQQAEGRSMSAMQGLSRSLIANMVQGVTEGFIKKLEIQGVGFRANVQANVLNLSLGFSHPVAFAIPEGITVTVTDNTKISIEGIDKQKVGQVAADIRAYYPPEPYKGKGVRYEGEIVRRKEGKKQA
ncbi:MAG: 50S ribosomal protein L6 [Verrucomicrobiales bacterium]